jgi:pimeloyl-ACP methyl ester carboxylesterase
MDLARLKTGTALDQHPAVLRSVEVQLASAVWVQFREDGWVLLQDEQAVIVCPTGEQRVQASFEQFVTVFDVEDRLGEIRMPTLITAAGQDQVIPMSHSEQLRDGIPGAQFVVLPDSGHGDVDPTSADGQQWCATIHQFLDRLSRPAPPALG